MSIEDINVTFEIRPKVTVKDITKDFVTVEYDDGNGRTSCIMLSEGDKLDLGPFTCTITAC